MTSDDRWVYNGNKRDCEEGREIVKIFREYLWDVFTLLIVVEKKARICFVLMLRVKEIWCTKLIQGVAENDSKDAVYDAVQQMHRVFCTDEMMQSVWKEREWQLRRSKDRMSKKIEARVVSIWWDGVERIYDDVKRKWEVLIDNGETDVGIEVEMRKR